MLTLRQKTTRTRSRMLQLIDAQKVHAEGTPRYNEIDQDIKLCQMKLLSIAREMRRLHREGVAWPRVGDYRG